MTSQLSDINGLLLAIQIMLTVIAIQLAVLITVVLRRK